MKYVLFSNGTEFERWYERNCERCVKASRYNERMEIYTKYRCAIQKHIDLASVADGTGNERDYNATHSYICPYVQAERKQYNRKKKSDKRQLELFEIK